MRRLIFAIVFLAAVAANAADPQYLPQNWTQTDRSWFYTTPQGSKLIPYAWALALEQPYSEQLFFADGLARMHYLPNPKSKDNPDGLPVGFVRDPGGKVAHLGMTCAACHTNQIDYNGATYQIDGAPTGADLFGFLAELGESLSVTTASADDPKFTRFAARVLGKRASAKQRAALYADVKKFTKYFAQFVTDTTPTHSWGLARADAFGAIFNRVTSIDLHIPSNSMPPDAPVSYPFLWDTSWHNVVQWNGSAPNEFALLRLARNIGEVLGVFAEIDIDPKAHRYYKSTAKRINLLEIEDRLANLRSPRWPNTFPALDAAKVTAGQAIYEKQCRNCHDLATPGVFQKVTMTPLTNVGTDPVMVTVAATRQNLTGVLQGVKKQILFGEPFGATAGAGSITFNAVLGAGIAPLSLEDLLALHRMAKTKSAATSTRTGEGSEHDLREDLASAAHKIEGKADPVRGDLERALAALQSLTSSDATLAYKARPLDGIWATAPYLHNGSVPTLRDLLLPQAQRPKTFYVGSRELDPVNVGFQTAQAPGAFLFDTSLAGNSNAGHPYGTQLNEQDRSALLEYLKSL